MSAGRIRYLGPGEKGPKSPAFALRFESGGELVLTEAGKKKRAGVWLETPAQTEAELAHLGPEALGLGAERLRGDPRGRQPAPPPAAARPACARRDRPRTRERDPPPRAALAVRALDAALRRGDRAARGRDRRGPRARARAAAAGKGDKDVYLVHRRLGEPCPRCGDAAAAGRLRGAHRLLLRGLPDRRPCPQRPPPLAPAALAPVCSGRVQGLSLGHVP